MTDDLDRIEATLNAAVEAALVCRVCHAMLDVPPGYTLYDSICHLCLIDELEADACALAIAAEDALAAPTLEDARAILAKALATHYRQSK